jgi:hypothetical protein
MMEGCDVEVVNLKWIFEEAFGEAGHTWPRFAQVSTFPFDTVKVTYHVETPELELFLSKLFTFDFLYKAFCTPF